MSMRQLPLPGSPAGPCKDACQHERCQRVRSIARSACTSCGGWIGYLRYFYTDLNHGREVYVHVSCRQQELRAAGKRIRRRRRERR